MGDILQAGVPLLGPQSIFFHPHSHAILSFFIYLGASFGYSILLHEFLGYETYS